MEKRFAQIIYPNYNNQAVVPGNGTDFTVKELQDIVGGSIERIELPDNMALVVNQDRVLQKLPYNEFASMLFNFNLYGNVILCYQDMI